MGSSDFFLGLGIVAVEELLITPSQRHVIPLQGRPFEDGDGAVNGLLTVQVRLIMIRGGLCRLYGFLFQFVLLDFQERGIDIGPKASNGFRAAAAGNNAQQQANPGWLT